MQSINNKYHFAISETLKELKQGLNYFEDILNTSMSSHEVLFSQFKLYLTKVMDQMESNLNKFQEKHVEGNNRSKSNSSSDGEPGCIISP